MDNDFLLPKSAYQRDFSIISGYYHDSALYLQLNTGMAYDQCLAFVKRYTSPHVDTGFKNPKALVLTRNDVWDREISEQTFMGFLQRVKDQNLLLSPSMAAYLPESVKVSTHAEYIREGVKKRKVVKNEMMAAKEQQNAELALTKDGEQKNLKGNSNSYSGATVSQATILYFCSTHSSLTSTCRTATSYANSMNEKLLGGNRHYYNAEVTKANLLSIINTCDLDAIETACNTFGLHYPSADEVLACVQHSIQHYWNSPQQDEIILRMAHNMTPAQRAAVVYVNDLYHLYQHNPDFIYKFLMALSETADMSDPNTVTLSRETFASLDDDVKILANFLCYDDAQGRNEETLEEEAPWVLDKIRATGHRILTTVTHFRQFIRAFFLVQTVPSSIHAMPTSYRTSAILSDTDSTLFTVQWWIEQFFGHISFSVRAKQVVFGMVFIVSEMLVHVLSILSANMGVGDEKLRMLAMKNEYYFSVLAMTTRSKHYYASRDAQEGVMFSTPELEVKGVGLRNSKVPLEVNQRAKAMMTDIMDTLKSERALVIHEKIKEVADMERRIRDSILAGQAQYLESGQIKAAESYKQGTASPAYTQYLLWRDVFVPDYGAVQPPPYSVFKVSLRANNRTEIQQWLGQMGNTALAARLEAWLHAERKSTLTTLMIPSPVVETYGIPKEIIPGIDIRKIIANTMSVFYLMFESLGILIQEKNNVRLLSDFY